MKNGFSNSNSNSGGGGGGFGRKRRAETSAAAEAEASTTITTPLKATIQSTRGLGGSLSTAADYDGSTSAGFAADEDTVREWLEEVEEEYRQDAAGAEAEEAEAGETEAEAEAEENVEAEAEDEAEAEENQLEAEAEAEGETVEEAVGDDAGEVGDDGEAAAGAEAEAEAVVITSGSYCGIDYADAELQCSAVRKCNYPEDCVGLLLDGTMDGTSSSSSPIGCYGGILCAVSPEGEEEAAAAAAAEEPAAEEPAAEEQAPTVSPAIDVEPVEPTAAPIVPSTAAPVVVPDDDPDASATGMGTEPTAMPTAAVEDDVGAGADSSDDDADDGEDETDKAVADVVGDGSGEEEQEEEQQQQQPPMGDDSSTTTESIGIDTTGPTSAPTTATATTAVPTAAPTPSPPPPPPPAVITETDSSGNPILYSCADAIPPLTDPVTGATAPAWSTMDVEFDYEMYWNDDDEQQDSGETEPPPDLDDVAPDLDDGAVLGRCQADCDSDEQCDGDLVCFERDAFEAVPGCLGDGTKEWDYCVDPNDVRRGLLRRHLVTTDQLSEIAAVSGRYLSALASQYGLDGEDCSAVVDGGGGGVRRTMLRRALYAGTRTLQDGTTVVEIGDGGDAMDDADVECVTSPPSDYPMASCIPVKGKVNVKYTGTDEASITSFITSSAKEQLESLTSDASGSFAGIAFVGKRANEGGGRDNLNPFPGNLNPGVAAAGVQQENEPEGWWSTFYSPLGIAFMTGLALAVLLVGLLVGRSVRSRRRRNRAIKEKSASVRSASMADEGSFRAAISVSSDSRMGIERREDEQGRQIMVSPSKTDATADLDRSVEFGEVEVELNTDAVANPKEKKRFRGLFRSRSRSKSPSNSITDGEPTDNNVGARSILNDLSQEEGMLAAAPPLNRTSTNASVEACLDYYNYDDTLVDTRGHSVTPTRSLIDDDEDIYGIVNLE